MKFFEAEIKQELSPEPPLVELAGQIEKVMLLLAQAWYAATDEKGPERYTNSFARLREASSILNGFFGTEPDCDDGVGVSIDRIREETFANIRDLAYASSKLNELAEEATDEDVEKVVTRMRRQLKCTQMTLSRLVNSRTNKQLLRLERLQKGQPETDPAVN